MLCHGISNTELYSIHIFICFANFLEMFWQCFTNILAMFWQFVNNIIDIVLATFLQCFCNILAILLAIFWQCIGNGLAKCELTKHCQHIAKILLKHCQKISKIQVNTSNLILWTLGSNCGEIHVSGLWLAKNVTEKPLMVSTCQLTSRNEKKHVERSEKLF